METETFFESLSVVGWVGVFLWVIFFISVVFRFEWYSKYDERVPPRFSFTDEFLYEEWHYIVFMVARFILMVVILYIVTNILYKF